MLRHTILLAAGLALLGTGAIAQEGKPGVIVGGATGVTINGRPAARQGDATSGGTIRTGSSNVFINGKPVATVGDDAGCGMIVSGSRGVFVNGRPIAASGDVTSCGH
ncbi:PAAR domain-containing protein [Methylobacterium gnaphalii]|uniref:PAAR motif-containing protein n=1 Tax=Methylobacterium gnaphalii TaxID=1010610 RepID=A0A512JIZ5_9HYPH|nr:PAAR domain-containing protein [Methylobacterium gnaphalii]GEP09935.1 hypothetical protein MGN01_17800 [Methylobacterium gnaphalii]GJD68290.1 hypothetical protein MMMDOFMJ_1209 [Methylobacterium gnaphalii]GLS51790.1 hypothetical protein GCM10007885_46510 [Methylobacterium gnaphalii]